MIVAVAGRRMDADARRIEGVRRRVRALFAEEGVVAVVSSAACGADLIAQSEAGAMGLRRRIVLPYGRERFRETSVVDRPGDWGAVYDRVLGEVDDVVVLPEADEPYRAANEAILDEAAKLAAELGQEAAAVLVWDGASRGERDWTAAFGRAARERGWRVLEVSTQVTPGV